MAFTHCSLSGGHLDKLEHLLLVLANHLVIDNGLLQIVKVCSPVLAQLNGISIFNPLAFDRLSVCVGCGSSGKLDINFLIRRLIDHRCLFES